MYNLPTFVAMAKQKKKLSGEGQVAPEAEATGELEKLVTEIHDEVTPVTVRVAFSFLTGLTRRGSTVL